MRNFPDIKSAHHAETYLSLKRRDPETVNALIKYVATLGIIRYQGKFHQYYEFDPITGALNRAVVRLDGFISEASIVKRRGYQYASAWNDEKALEYFKQLNQNHQ